MAKKLNIEAEEELKSAPVEEQNEGIVVEDKRRTAEEVVVSVGSKKVKVQVTEEVDCIVACTPYKLSKDKAYLVPSDVAAILCGAKKAYRI